MPYYLLSLSPLLLLSVSSIPFLRLDSVLFWLAHSFPFGVPLSAFRCFGVVQIHLALQMRILPFFLFAYPYLQLFHTHCPHLCIAKNCLSCGIINVYIGEKTNVTLNDRTVLDCSNLLAVHV